jgi:ATP-dependent helicase/nuclease subunit A
MAALLRPPFFALDLGDLARERRDDPADHVVQARGVIRELRRRRFERSPGETARALLEETGIGRTIALGPNGAQRISALRELCFQVEARALDERLDFDATIERLRTWIDEPAGLDRPHPVGGDTVRVMTIHQAKGLEFPAVMLWDARATWNERTTYDAWTVDRDGRGWALRLDLVRWEEPPGLDIAERERDMRRAERKRLIYVAATRARDLLVIPKVGAPDDRWIFGSLLGGRQLATVLEQPLQTPDLHAPWFDAATPASAPLPREVTTLDVEQRAKWDAASNRSIQERMRPIAFTDATTPRVLWGKKGRFGTVFGETVHMAIGIALRTEAPAGDAVRTASMQTGLCEHLADAADDVARAMATLGALGIGPNAFELEYPISALTADGRLVSGYIDLLAMTEHETLLVDFKTDTPPASGESPTPKYVEQVTGYADVVSRALSVRVRAGLLYTADGAVRWLSSRDNGRS